MNAKTPTESEKSLNILIFVKDLENYFSTTFFGLNIYIKLLLQKYKFNSKGMILINEEF